MKKLELLVPPPVVMLLTGGLMWTFDKLFPTLSFEWLERPALGVTVGGFGLVLSLLAVLSFKRLRTTVDPRRPEASSRLATAGVYRYSRNPMYVGVFLILVGWALILGNLMSVLAAFLFVAYITRYQILPEEHMLEARFGDDFRMYKSKVRRWI